MIKRILAVMMILVSTGAAAQHANGSMQPTEVGQAQFAAIAEIVERLRNDQSTDWQTVDIDALRSHLVDMNNVTTAAIVDQIVDDKSISFVVTGDVATALSIQTMVIAHSPMLQQATGWDVVAKSDPSGATMVITTESPDQMSEIIGLGFFGVMTIGAHHQQHHLLIAGGRSPH